MIVLAAGRHSLETLIRAAELSVFVHPTTVCRVFAHVEWWCSRDDTPECLTRWDPFHLQTKAHVSERDATLWPGAGRVAAVLCSHLCLTMVAFHWASFVTGSN